MQRRTTFKTVSHLICTRLFGISDSIKFSTKVEKIVMSAGKNYFHQFMAVSDDFKNNERLKIVIFCKILSTVVSKNLTQTIVTFCRIWLNRTQTTFFALAWELILLPGSNKNRQIFVNIFWNYQNFSLIKYQNFLVDFATPNISLAVESPSPVTVTS